MKKTFPLQEAGKDPHRVLERVRSEVGKYVNREKRKALPENHDQWDFACRVGADAETAITLSVKQVSEAIGQVASSGAPVVYVEIIASAKPAAPRPEPER